MNINKITDLLEEWYPLDLAEEWDTTGLQIKPKSEEITGIIVGLTLTNDLVEKALKSGMNLIICHHPMFFNDDNKNDLLNKKSINLSKLLTAKGIGFYALHTNFDKKHMGKILADLLDLKNIRVLDSVTSLGIIGELKKPCTYEELLKDVSALLNLDCISYSDIDLARKFETVALCPGSGREFLDLAIEQTDVYLTGDLNYHSFEKAVYFNYPLIDICHYNSEIIGMKSLADKMKEMIELPVEYEAGKDFHNKFKKNS